MYLLYMPFIGVIFLLKTIYRLIYLLLWIVWNFKFPKKFYFSLHDEDDEYKSYYIVHSIWEALSTVFIDSDSWGDVCNETVRQPEACDAEIGFMF